MKDNTNISAITGRDESDAGMYAIDGVSVEVSAEHLVVRSETELNVVATAPVGAALARVRHFLSIPAPSGLDCHDPGTPLRARALQLGLDAHFIGFLTAVKLTGAVARGASDGERTVLAVATVGVSNASRPGEEVAAHAPGTINLVVIIDADLPANALHEALTTAAEAKALSVYESGTLTRGGLPATGTSTDAYAVACTGRGPHDRYAGAVSPVGYLVGRAVRDAVGAGLVPALERMDRDGRA